MSESLVSSREKLVRMFEALPQKADIAAMETPALLGILDDAPLAIGRLLAIYAAVWLELEERGENLARYIDGDNEVYRWVRRIAHGRVSADAVAKFGSNTRVMRTVAKLPIVVQEKLAADPKIALLDPAKPEDPGSFKLKSIADMEKHELEQVFDDKTQELRTPEAQAKYLTAFSAPASSPRKRRELVRGSVIIDRESNRLRTDGPDAPLRDVVAALKDMGYKIEKPE